MHHGVQDLSGVLSPAQTLLKTLSFAAVHFIVALVVGWVLTGSFVLASVMALVEPACNTVAYFFHERLWQRRGRRLASAGG